VVVNQKEEKKNNNIEDDVDKQERREEEYAQAVADYDGVPNDTRVLSFKKNDILLVVEKNNNGWWWCKVGNKKGYAPNNFLTGIEKELL
jgi:hypothetical protein